MASGDPCMECLKVKGDCGKHTPYDSALIQAQANESTMRGRLVSMETHYLKELNMLQEELLKAKQARAFADEQHQACATEMLTLSEQREKLQTEVYETRERMHQFGRERDDALYHLEKLKGRTLKQENAEHNRRFEMKKEHEETRKMLRDTQNLLRELNRKL